MAEAPLLSCFSVNSVVARDSLKAVTIVLDEYDPGEQKKYLASILHRAKSTQESLSFQYDLDGQSHWNGQHFILDVDAVCYLRMTDRRDFETLAARHRAAIQRGLGQPTPTQDGFFEVSTGKSLNELTVDDFYIAISLFAVQQIMES